MKRIIMNWCFRREGGCPFEDYPDLDWATVVEYVKLEIDVAIWLHHNPEHKD